MKKRIILFLISLFLLPFCLISQVDAYELKPNFWWTANYPNMTKDSFIHTQNANSTFKLGIQIDWSMYTEYAATIRFVKFSICSTASSNLKVKDGTIYFTDSYFDSSDAFIYNTRQSCKIDNSRNGTLYFAFTQIGKSNEMILEDYFDIVNNTNQSVTNRYYDLILSDNDLSTSYRQSGALGDVLDNLENQQEQNKNDILDNQNQNKDDIIENQEQVGEKLGELVQGGLDNLKDKIHDSFNSCRPSNNLFNINDVNNVLPNFQNLRYEIDDNKLILSSVGTSGAQYVSYLFSNFDETKTYTISFKGIKLSKGNDGISRISLIIYASNSGLNSDFKSIKSVFSDSDNTELNKVYSFSVSFSGYKYYKFYFYNNNSTPVSLEDKTVYYDIQLEEGSFASKYEPFAEDVCSNKIDETNDKIDNLTGSITDSNIDSSSSQFTSFFDDFEDNDFGLSDIITAPLELVKSLTSKTCSTISLPLPYINENLKLPCLTAIYEQYFGSFLKLYQTVMHGIVSYYVMIHIYALVKGFKDPDDDKIEVMDL